MTGAEERDETDGSVLDESDPAPVETESTEAPAPVPGRNGGFVGWVGPV